MIKEYVNKLMNELPDIICKNNKQNIDLILDGGIFNGSYLFGALFFLKEMENRKFIKIDKLSGCSIGSIGAILYLIDELNIVTEFYEIIMEHFKKEHNLNKFDSFLKKIKEKMPETFWNDISGRLYITYYNIEKGKKIVKSNYKSNDDLIDIVRRSCSVPYMMDGNVLYKNKFCDGIFPYIFPRTEKKTLYIDLFGSDKLSHLLSVKNENSNFHRILSGVLDCHLFFIKQSSTQMCSFIENWSIFDWFHHRVKKYIVEKIIIWSICLIIWCKKNISLDLYYNTIFFKIGKKIIEDVYIIMIENYCF